MSRTKVLIAVDDEKLRKLISNKLKETLGMDCIEANNGKDAIGRMILEDPHLLLLDLDIPVMNGIEILNFIRGGSIESKEKMPIIIIAGFLEKNEVMEILKMGASGIIIKPIDYKELFKKIKNILFK